MSGLSDRINIREICVWAAMGELMRLLNGYTLCSDILTGNSNGSSISGLPLFVNFIILKNE
jgi:hypothetical protein